MIDLKQALSTESSRVLIDAVVEHIGSNEKLFEELFHLIFSEKYPLCMRSAWAAMHACKKNPTLFIPYTNDQTIEKALTHPENGVRRCFLKIFADFAKIELLPDCGMLLNFCLNILEKPSEAVANKAYSMEIILKICKNEPDLAKEITLLLQKLMEEEQLPGFTSKANKVIRVLNPSKKQGD